MYLLHRTESCEDQRGIALMLRKPYAQFLNSQPLWPSAAIKTCSAENNAEHLLKASCAPCLPAAWKSSGSCASICHKVVLGLAQHGAECNQKSCLVPGGDYDYYQHSCEDVFCWKMLSRTSVSPGKLTGNGPARSFTHEIFLQLWPILPFLSPLLYNISGWDQLQPCNNAEHYTQLNGKALTPASVVFSLQTKQTFRLSAAGGCEEH